MLFQRSIYGMALLLLSANNMITASNAASSDEGLVFSTAEECARTCVAGAAPKICYYKFTLENYHVLNSACQLCIPEPNNTFTSNCQCVWADGIEKSIMTVNRILPGPSIEVCLGDKIVVDVINHIAGNEVTIHWHGLFQNGTPYMDGVPMVTQCPIHQGATFRYQFMAGNVGTHFWHSHSSFQKFNGISGSIIVREPKSLDVHGDLYDYDNCSTVIFVADWIHELGEQKFPGRIYSDIGQNPTNLLINGKGRYSDPETKYSTKIPLEVFKVEHGKKYRFRFINAFSNVCPAQLNVQEHNITIIATDGEPVEPVVVDTLISYSGDRYDFILNANKSVGSYWIQLRALGECDEIKLQQLAILRYEGGSEYPLIRAPEYEKCLPSKTFLNPLDGICNVTRKNVVCVNQLRNLAAIEEDIYTSNPDVKINLEYKLYSYNSSTLFKPHTYSTYTLGGNDGIAGIFLINDIYYHHTPSPILSQYNDINPEMFCNATKRPQDCVEGEPCHCTHKMNIPLNAIVEIDLIDKGGVMGVLHPFHLHGHLFHVIAMGTFEPDQNSDCQRKRVLDSARAAGLTPDSKPPKKDTLSVPQNGFVILRFRANNPGFWLFHCHFIYHTNIGMDNVFQVGNLEDFPSVPDGFPRCGNFQQTITSY